MWLAKASHLLNSIERLNVFSQNPNIFLTIFLMGYCDLFKGMSDIYRQQKEKLWNNSPASINQKGKPLHVAKIWEGRLASPPQVPILWCLLKRGFMFSRISPTV